MQYNFDQIIDRRRTNSLSADGFRGFLHANTGRSFDRADDGFIRMWVADMDFAVPDVILDAVRAHTLKDLVTCLEGIDPELVRGAVAGEKFQELFFANAKDEKIIAYVKTLLA